MHENTIFVTGATGGIGNAIVRRMLRRGYRVAAADAVASEAPTDVEPSNFLSLTFDIRDAGAAKDAIDEAARKFGRLDALVNVAGVCYGGDPETASASEWETTFDINVKGMFQLTQAALPHLKVQVRSDIVNISSIWGVDHTSALLSYSASKFAVEGLSGGLRMWGMPRNIRVCALQVDKVDTGFRRHLGSAGDFPREKLDRMLTPDDVASAVEFVLATPNTAQVSSMRLDAPLWYQA